LDFNTGCPGLYQLAVPIELQWTRGSPLKTIATNTTVNMRPFIPIKRLTE